jgi:hypothetical protein
MMNCCFDTVNSGYLPLATPAQLALSGICPDCGQPMPPMTQEELSAMLECWGDNCPLCCFKCLVDASLLPYQVDGEVAVKELQEWWPEAVDTSEKRAYVRAVALKKKVVWLNPYRDVSAFYLD